MEKVAVVFFYRDAKILMGLRDQVEVHSGCWGLPGGRLEKNESPRDAAIREATEEVGLTPSIFESACQLVDLSGTDYSFYLCRQWEGEPKNLEPEKCSQLQWFELDRLPGNTIGIIAEAIDVLAIQKHADP